MVLLNAKGQPKLVGFFICLETLRSVAFEVGYVEAVCGQAIDFGEQLPCEGRSLFLQRYSELVEASWAKRELQTLK